MNDEEILKLLNILIGKTSATGSHSIDMDERLPNVETLGLVTTDLIDHLLYIATSFENRTESSINAIGKKARHWINFIENEMLDTKKD